MSHGACRRRDCKIEPSASVVPIRVLHPPMDGEAMLTREGLLMEVLTCCRCTAHLRPAEARAKRRGAAVVCGVCGGHEFALC